MTWQRRCSVKRELAVFGLVCVHWPLLDREHVVGLAARDNK